MVLALVLVLEAALPRAGGPAGRGGGQWGGRVKGWQPGLLPPKVPVPMRWRQSGLGSCEIAISTRSAVAVLLAFLRDRDKSGSTCKTHCFHFLCAYRADRPINEARRRDQLAR